MLTNVVDDSGGKTGGESLLDKRIRRRAKNKLKKEESKRLREEELRRKLCEPKDQRVRVVNRNELEVLRKQQQNVQSHHMLPNISAEEFPSLDDARSKTKDKNQKLFPNSQPVASLSDSEFKSSGSVMKDETIKSHGSPKTSPVSVSPSKKNEMLNAPPVKPKRNDPICIDVMSALKKREPPNIPEGRPILTKKDVSPRLGGNQLDSSNPERKKGKTREVPKEKKPTLLKRVILKERETKKHIRENHSSLGELLTESHADESMLVHPALQTSDHNLETNTNINIATEPNETVQSSTDMPHDAEGLDVITENEEVTLRSRDIARLEMHSRKFREYCDHVLSQDLDTAVSALVTDIVKYQDRVYFNDPIKAHAKRRFVIGFREVNKYLGLNKLKLIIIAPDLEKVSSKGGLDEVIEHLKLNAASLEVPCAFAVGRKKLKILTNKSRKIPGISCIGILNWEGSEDNFSTIQSLLPALRKEYAHKVDTINKQFESDCKIEDPPAAPLVEEVEVEPPGDVNTEVVAAFLSKLTKELRNQ